MDVPLQISGGIFYGFRQKCFAPVDRNKFENRVSFVRQFLRKIDPGDEVFKQAAHEDQNDKMWCLSFARVGGNWAGLDDFDGELPLVADGKPGKASRYAM